MFALWINGDRFMNKRRHRKTYFWAGLIAGLLADGYLRLVSGDEGNLLVHTAVFMGSAMLAALMVKTFLCLKGRSNGRYE